MPAAAAAGQGGWPATPLGQRLALLLARLADIFCLQVDAFEEAHADLAFDGERVKTMQVMLRSLAAMEELAGRLAGDGEEARLGPGDIVEFRRQLAGRLAALGGLPEPGEMGGRP